MGLPMQSPTPILNQFIQPVPTCPTDANLRVMVEKFHSSQSEVMVVVDEQLFPVGILCLSHLLPYIKPKLLAQTTPDKENKIQTLAYSLMIPVVSLSAYLSLEELCKNLQSWQCSAKNQSHCVLVDYQGKFLGLLDTRGLLKYLLSPSISALDTISPRDDNCEQVGSRSWQPTHLVRLMEQLPLPLRLETSSGEIVFQNSTWRSQIGAREISEVNLSCSLMTSERALTSPVKSLVESSFQTDRSILSDPKPEVELQPCCQTYRPIAISNQARLLVDANLSNLELPETRIHQEGTWQFVKMPISLSDNSPVTTLEKTSRITQNQSPGWLVMATDVTEQEKLCKELAAKNADLVQLNRLKDEFLACISHELKSPLTAVVGLSSLLKDESLGKLNQRQARYANLIYQSGHHLMTLVNDILDLTRLETGQLQLTLEPLNLQSVCERAYQQALQLQSFREQTKESWEDNKFTLEIEPGLDLMVADEMRLRQMLVHLLDNALKFTEASGEIGLQVSNWEGWIAFTIWDTGVGIPPALQHLIFQKFQQLENPLTRRFEGTGLGLVLTQRLARAHGGDISFTSKVGQGSQFTLLLPPSPPQEHNHNQGSKQGESEDSWQEIPFHPPVTTNRLVLVVEAVPRYIEDLTGQLRELGYRVVIARSGTEALEKARSLQPRVILLNPLLPLLSGWDVLVLLKSDAKTSQIPILVTSTRGEKQRAEQNGADGFLCLPVEKADLNSSLECLGEPISSQSKRLTILRLREATKISSLHDLDLALSSQSSALNYRILEAEDVEQADIIARVWHPDVVLLDGEDLSNPLEYLHNLSQQPALAALPLVTLDAKTTQAANQLPNLTAFPCLVDSGEESLEALLEVIQVASGMGSQSHVLVYGNWEKTSSQQEKVNSGQSKSTGEYEWLQALVHYLQTAGLRSSLSNSWQEVYSQIQYRSLDLLLLYVDDREDYGNLIRQLQPLAKMENKPTILVFDHRCLGYQSDSNDQEKLLNQLLDTIATKVFQAHSYSMSDLLAQINRMVSH